MSLIEHNQLAGLGIDAGGHQLGGDRNYRIPGLGENEVVELCLAFFIVAGNPHDVLGILSNQIAIFIDQCLAHPLGVVDVIAKDDGFVETIGLF